MLIGKNVFSQEGQEEIAEVFNKFFTNIVPSLAISTDHDYDNDFIAIDDQISL